MKAAIILTLCLFTIVSTNNGFLAESHAENLKVFYSPIEYIRQQAKLVSPSIPAIMKCLYFVGSKVHVGWTELKKLYELVKTKKSVDEIITELATIFNIGEEVFEQCRPIFSN